MNSLNNEQLFYALYSNTQYQNTKNAYVYKNKDGNEVVVTEVVNCSYFSTKEEAMKNACKFDDVKYKGIVYEWVRSI